MGEQLCVVQCCILFSEFKIHCSPVCPSGAFFLAFNECYWSARPKTHTHTHARMHTQIPLDPGEAGYSAKAPIATKLGRKVEWHLLSDMRVSDMMSLSFQ